MAAAIVNADEWEARQAEDGKQCPFDNTAATALAAASIIIIIIIFIISISISIAGWLSDGWSSRRFNGRSRSLLRTEYIAQHYSTHGGLNSYCCSVLVFDDYSCHFSLDHHHIAVFVHYYRALNMFGHAHLPAGQSEHKQLCAALANIIPTNHRQQSLHCKVN